MGRTCAISAVVVIALLTSGGVAPGGADRGAAGKDAARAAKPQRIVYVLDASGTMLDQFDNLRDQIRLAVEDLGPEQSFTLICFREGQFLALGERELMSATADNKHKAAAFLSRVVPRGDSNPLGALEHAFRLRPDVIHLLADGDFTGPGGNKAVIELCRARNAGARINTLAVIESGADAHNLTLVAALRTIAEDSGGKAKVITEAQLAGAAGPPAAADAPGVRRPTTSPAKPSPAAVPASRPANPQRVVFVLDSSGSMLDMFDALRNETRWAIERLDPAQSFNVIFFQDSRFLAPDDRQLLPALSENKKKTIEFLGNVVPRGTTDPIPALEFAFKLRPDVIYLLSDGDFSGPGNEKTIEFCHAARGQARIHTFAFVSSDSQHAPQDLAFVASLKTIARNSGGDFRVVNEDDLKATSPKRVFDKH